MSLDKAIEHGKEKRKPYRGSKAIDCTCRNHGSCEWCLENRLIQKLRREEAMTIEERDWNMQKEAVWKHLHGVVTPGGDPYYECSNCGWGRCEGVEHPKPLEDECPNCGARMTKIVE